VINQDVMFYNLQYVALPFLIWVRYRVCSLSTWSLRLE